MFAATNMCIKLEDGQKFTLVCGEDIVGDKYDSLAVTKLMKNYSTLAASSILLNRLDKTINKTFVDILILHIDKKGMRDSEVYKAAQIDRRLFSKIMSDRQYKPSKDTVIAISIALKRLEEEFDSKLINSALGFRSYVIIMPFGPTTVGMLP